MKNALVRVQFLPDHETTNFNLISPNKRTVASYRKIIGHLKNTSKNGQPLAFILVGVSLHALITSQEGFFSIGVSVGTLR